MTAIEGELDGADIAIDTEYEEIVRQVLRRDIALVAASRWFDADWYLDVYPDVRAAAMQPAEHYVVYGWLEDRDPGPHFSTGWYRERYPEVVELSLNPLVHYLTYGEAEGCLPNADGARPLSADRAGGDAAPPFPATLTSMQIEDANLVRHSPFFDAAWYRARHPLLAQHGIDPAEHYVVVGGETGEDPGPRFSTAWYLDRYPDVAANRLNALVHFLRYGRSEGREPAPAELMAIGLMAPAAVLSAGSHEPSAPGSETHVVAATVMLRDVRLGSAEWAQPRPALIPSLLAFARMHGWDETFALEIRDAETGRPLKSPVPRLDLHRWQMLPEIADVGARIADLWFAAATLLRIRIDAVSGATFGSAVSLHFYQADADALVSCGGVALAGSGPAIVDVALVNAYKPILVTVMDGAGSLVDALLVPFPSLVRGGVHHGEVVAHGERGSRMADLAALSEGYLQELLGWGDQARPLSLAAIDVDLGTAIGAERIFSDPVRVWLATVLNIAVEPRADPCARGAERHLVDALSLPPDLSAAAAQAIVERGRRGGSRLVIPADAVPTIAALVSRRIPSPGGSAAAMPYIIADPVTAAPALFVSLPPLDGLADLQPIGQLPFPLLVASAAGLSAPAEEAGAFAMPAAIRFADGHPDLARSLFPYAADAPGSPIAKPPAAPEWHDRTISVLIAPTGSPDTLTGLLTSLANQDAAAALDVTVVLGPGNAEARDELDHSMDALFREHGRITTSTVERPSERLNEAARSARGDYLLVLDQAMILHDVRTVATLFAIADGADVASVGCAQVRDGGSKDAPTVAAGCFFPSRIALSMKPGILYEEPVTSGILVHATLPVVANSFRTVLIAADAWLQVGGVDADRFPVGGYELDFALKTARRGFRHLNTTAVTVTDRARRGATWARDPVGINFLPSQGWQDVAAAVSLIRELR